MKVHLLLAATLTGTAVEARAASQPPPADKEMLKIMDFLTDWDVIQDMEKMKQMEQLARDGENTAPAGTRARTPGKKKEPAK